MFSRQHYNAIAKDIREEFPLDHEYTAERTAITLLACRLARRFKADNERFDPVAFLNACSPDTELYPLGELWDD